MKSIEIGEAGNSVRTQGHANQCNITVTAVLLGNGYAFEEVIEILYTTWRF
jgi:hypothetical protein